MNKQRHELKDYIHQDLNREVSAIAGYYVLTNEIRLLFHEWEVLYLTGYVVLDNSCCGSGSFYYAIVPGIIVDWKYKKTDDGLPVSRLELIRDEAVQNDIRLLIQKKEMFTQVNFQ